MRAEPRSALRANLLFFGGTALVVAGLVLAKDRTALGTCLAVAGFVVAVAGFVSSGPSPSGPEAGGPGRSADA